ncbi:hypothetical protein [Thermocatellispora tengchongensis]|uniref:hypothetical protein n=1 Tax=Thermocatellispora tengchongensis TaxID=1073253 RepID=UPI00363F2E90
MIPDENDALRRDAQDPGHRELFRVPPADGGRYAETAYLAGNSLGLQPRATRQELLEDLDAWARLGVEGHLEAERPWLPYHELLTADAATLVGALPEETVVMNSLTVNLHLLMVSFYRPRGERTRILIEDTAFPPTATPCAARPASTAWTPTRPWCGCARAPARTPCAPRTSPATWSARATGSPWSCSAGSTTSPAS